MTAAPLDFPWSVDGRGRTRASTDHLRDLIEQVLLTAPGERVMRPGFGAGLLAAVFEPGGPEAAVTTQFLVQAALQRELGDLIGVAAVDVAAAGSALVVTVTYTVLRTGATAVAVVRGA